MEINITQILFQIVNFSVVVGALTVLLYKPILKIFEERARRIEEGLKAASASIAQQERIEELKKEAKKTLTKEKATILKESHTQAEEARLQMLAEARAEAQKYVEKMKADWQVEQQQLLKQAHASMVEAVISTTEKVLGEKLNSDKKQKELIESELSVALKSL